MAEPGLTRRWSHPKARSHMQPSAAALQLSPWKEPFVSPGLKEICAGLFPPPVLLTLHGTWRTCSYHLASGVFPKLSHNSCCRLSLKTADFLFFFFIFTPLCLTSKFMNILLLNRSLQLVLRTVPYLILVFGPELYVKVNEHICSYEWGNCFFYIDIVYVDGLSCVSMFKEPCKWRFIMQLQSLSPVFFFWFFLTSMLCSNCFCETEGMDTLSCLSLLRGQLHFIKETSIVTSCWCL